MSDDGMEANLWVTRHIEEVVRVQAATSLIFAALRAGPHRPGDLTHAEIDEAETYFTQELERLAAKGATVNAALLLARSLSRHAPPTTTSDPLHATDVTPVEVAP